MLEGVGVGVSESACMRACVYVRACVPVSVCACLCVRECVCVLTPSVLCDPDVTLDLGTLTRGIVLRGELNCMYQGTCQNSRQL